MVDEIFHRQYDAGREQLNDGLDRLFARIREIGNGFRVLNRIQFAAPWAKPRRIAKAR